MMNTLALKLILTPALIGAASLAGRRWGPAVSGWLVGLPLTSGPIIFFLALAEGTAFAHSTALGTLAGTFSQGVVCVVYAWLSKRWAWPVTLTASVAAFAATTLMLQGVNLPLGWLYVLVAGMLGLILAAMPKGRAQPDAKSLLPVWDIPARMLVVTAYVIALTETATRVGPQLTGLLSPFPLYALVLAAFGQHFEGSQAAVQVLRGLVIGLFAFATFFLIVGALIETASLWVTFGAATAMALGMQACALWLIRKGAV